jgi:chemotaxis protein methyltransferase CheR
MPSRHPTSLSPKEFERVRNLVESKLGVLVPEGKRAMVQSRLARRYRQLGFAKIQDYCDYVFGTGASTNEPALLLEAITTNFTYFYREPQQLEHFARHLLPDLVEDAAERRRPLCVWSAACSTGEEPWTIAMLVDDAAKRLNRRIEFSVTATDVNGRVLETAERAVYTEAALEKVPVEWRARYFLVSRRAESGRIRVTPEIRAHATFRQMNLMDEAYPIARGQDVIFLRNVLIYFDAKTRERVVGRLAEHLRPGGLFLLGASESLNGMQLPLQYLQKSMYRKEG